MLTPSSTQDTKSCTGPAGNDRVGPVPETASEKRCPGQHLSSDQTQEGSEGRTGASTAEEAQELSRALRAGKVHKSLDGTEQSAHQVFIFSIFTQISILQHLTYLYLIPNAILVGQWLHSVLDPLLAFFLFLLPLPNNVIWSDLQGLCAQLPKRWDCSTISDRTSSIFSFSRPLS